MVAHETQKLLKLGTYSIIDHNDYGPVTQIKLSLLDGKKLSHQLGLIELLEIGLVCKCCETLEESHYHFLDCSLYLQHSLRDSCLVICNNDEEKRKNAFAQLGGMLQ